MLNTPYPLLESVHIKIISDNTDISMCPAFKECANLTQENWSVSIAELETNIRQQHVDILYLSSPPSSETLLALCQTLTVDAKEGLSIFIITLPKRKEFIQQAYRFGVKAFIDLPIVDVHFEHQLQKCMETILRQKKTKNSYKRLVNSHQLSKLCDFSWYVQQQSFYLPQETKLLLGLNTQSNIVSQHDFLQQLHEVNRENAAHFLESIKNDQQRIQTKIQVSHGILGFKDLLFTAELDNTESDGLVYQGCLQDISELNERNDSIHHLAYHDSLTGLANRRYLINQLESLVLLSEREELNFSVLFLDLDGFKQVNDQLGHETGDMLLIEVAQNLQKISQDDLFIARLGGDEFCIIVEHGANAEDVALGLANNIVNEFKHSLFLEKNQVHTTFSIGVAHFPKHGTQVSELLKSADLAMYEAKSKGKNCFELYTSKLIERSLNRIELEKELYHAYKNDQFELYYQPQIDLSTQQIVGVEALIRWIHPNKGIISPDDFIPMAEETRLINKIGHWVLKKACADAQLLHSKGLVITVAINVSPVQLYYGEFCRQVSDALTESGLEAQYLELEITESSFQVTEKNIDVFTQLRGLGVKIAIDDFGTGYSNLASLTQLPVDVLKIDRDFIKDIPHDNAAAAMTGSIIGMARIKDLKIIAEGIETIEQIQYLQGINCDIGQGYFIGKPMEFSHIWIFLKRQNSGESNLLEHNQRA